MTIKAFGKLSTINFVKSGNECYSSKVYKVHKVLNSPKFSNQVVTIKPLDYMINY